MYQFYEKLIIRTPSLAFEPNLLTEQDILKLLQESWFCEAIYLASPDLYDMAMSWLSGAKIEERKKIKMILSLTKYYSRMMSRCTPFGLFAACGVVKWNEAQNKNNLLSHDDFYRHTRFDMHFLCALAQKLAQFQGIKEHLVFRPNTSLYYLGDEIRYVEYHYVNGHRLHQISAVTYSEYLEKILQQSSSGLTLAELVNCLLDGEIEEEEAKNFIDELIASQLLVNNLEPAITGKEFFEQIIEILQQICHKTADEWLINLTNYLLNIHKKLKEIDKSDAVSIDTYRNLISKIRELGIGFEENKLFQTDLFRKPLTSVSIDKSLQKPLLKALEVLNKLSSQKENPNLLSFARRFYERYEDAEMPLLEVLDTETGIGYLENASNHISPLVEGIALPRNVDSNYSLEWTKIQTWLFEKLAEAQKKNMYEVCLTDADVTQFANVGFEKLPPSLSVMFKLIEKDQNPAILLEGFSGSSAINLLGRFAHGNNEILEMASNIATIEQDKNPEVIFAEVIHLPESRVGNILLHPSFRNYEIPYLAKSSLPNENQISLDDLYVSVRFDKIILRSKRLNKIIVPRLSTAHNYSYRALPVYQFLCDLQTQDMRSHLAFHWGNMAHQFNFLPRVSIKGVVLYAATWQLKKEHFSCLLGDFSEEALQHFLKKWNLPTWVVLADGDNELLVDWKNTLSVKVFVDAIKNRDSIVLKEFLYENTPTYSNTFQKPFINQHIALLIRNESTYTSLPVVSSKQNVTRRFSVGSEWLYFKVYCGSKVADKLLTEFIKPIVETLTSNSLIDKWFFIRYADPQLHLRIRFHLTNTAHLGNVLACIHSFLAKAEEAGYIWKMMLDTYQRELERYGFEHIELAETLFYEDSKAVIEMLDQTWGDARENLRWLWGIRAVDDLLDGFNLSITERKSLMMGLRNSFAEEFHVDTLFKQQMDKRFREQKIAISRILDKENDLQAEIYPLLNILKNKSFVLRQLQQEIINLSNENRLQVPFSQLLSSYIHMLVNRLIPNNQRLHELFIYDFMYRVYESTLAREKKESLQCD